MTPIVQVTDLRKRYGEIEAVRGISFFVEPGEVFGLLGPNGAGKTTTVEILEGLRKADGGSAIAMNAPARRTVKIGRRIIRIPRTHRPWYIWPSPGRKKDRTAAKPGEPFTLGAESERTGGNAADAAPRFDTEPLAYETRSPLDGAPASG